MNKKKTLICAWIGSWGKELSGRQNFKIENFKMQEVTEHHVERQCKVCLTIHCLIVDSQHVQILSKQRSNPDLKDQSIIMQFPHKRVIIARRKHYHPLVPTPQSPPGITLTDPEKRTVTSQRAWSPFFSHSYPRISILLFCLVGRKLSPARKMRERRSEYITLKEKVNFPRIFRFRQTYASHETVSLITTPATFVVMQAADATYLVANYRRRDCFFATLDLYLVDL